MSSHRFQESRPVSVRRVKLGGTARRAKRVAVSPRDEPAAPRARAPRPDLIPAASARAPPHASSLGLPANWNSTASTIKRSADEGDAACQFTYANILFQGRGVATDRRTAKVYFQRAADAGHVEAQCQFADILMQGWGIPKNPVLAAVYFQRAAVAGHLEGVYRYGKCLLDGAGVTQNRSGAAQWFQTGADEGHTLCQVEFAKICEGNGDLALAYKYSLMAAARCNPTAIAMCRRLA
jgi:TPR repeat protein